MPIDKLLSSPGRTGTLRRPSPGGALPEGETGAVAAHVAPAAGKKVNKMLSRIIIYLLFIPWQSCSAGAVGVVELHQAEEGHDLKDEAVFHLSGRLKNSFCRRIPLPSRSSLLVKLESLLPLAEAVAEFAKATRITTRSVAASDLISDLLFGSD